MYTSFALLLTTFVSLGQAETLDEGEGVSLLQAHAKRVDAKDDKLVDECPLPANSRWCEVRVPGTPSFKMAVYGSADIVSDSICNTGTWELQEKDVSELGAPGRALDIGANVGFYSLVLAAAGWNVTSFEPMATNSELIQASLCANPTLNSKVTLNRFGLGPKDDQCRIISGNDNVGDGVSQCGEDAKQPPQVGYSVRATIDIHRLDDILAQQQIDHIDFVKMDVEGFECKVMAGGQSLLSKYRPRLIQSEVWPHMQDCLPQDYLASFAKAKYTVAKDRACTLPDLTQPAEIDNRFMCQKGDGISLLGVGSSDAVTFKRNERGIVWLQADN